MLTELLEDVLRPHLPPPAPLTPVVTVSRCNNCPAAQAVWYSVAGPGVHCRLTGGFVAIKPHVDAAPSNCPLRSGDVTLRLVDRGRP